MKKIKQAKPRREYQWTDEYYENAQKEIMDEDIYPVVIPSYKRGNNALTIKLLRECPELKVILFVYEDDIQNYQETLDKYKHFSAIKCVVQGKDEVFDDDRVGMVKRGLGFKRVAINNKMPAMGYDRYFVLDDDISALYYTRHGKKNNGDYKAAKVELKATEFFKMWQYIITKKAPEPVAACGIISENGSWGQDLNTMDDITYVAGQSQILYIDGKMTQDKGLNYRGPSGWEDYDYSLTLINGGLNSCQIRYLTYSTPTMTPGKSVATTNEYGGATTIKDYGWTKKSMDLYAHWGELTRFKLMKGQLNSKIRWVTVRNMLKKNNGKLNITFDSKLKEYIDNNDPAGLLMYIEEKERIKKEKEEKKKTKIN